MRALHAIIGRDETAAAVDIADETFWRLTTAALFIARGHLRDRNGGEGGVMHSSCSRIPQTDEALDEMTDAIAYASSGDQPNAFVQGLIWAAGLSAIFWMGLGALVF